MPDHPEMGHKLKSADLDDLFGHVLCKIHVNMGESSVSFLNSGF